MPKYTIVIPIAGMATINIRATSAESAKHIACDELSLALEAMAEGYEDFPGGRMSFESTVALAAEMPEPGRAD